MINMLKHLRMWLRFCGDIRIESLLAAARKLSLALVTKLKKIFKSLNIYCCDWGRNPCMIVYLFTPPLCRPFSFFKIILFINIKFYSLPCPATLSSVPDF